MKTLKIQFNIIIRELRFISSIPANAKPCFKDHTIMSDNEWFVTLKRRWLKREGGDDGIIHVNNIFNICDNIYSNLSIDNIIMIKKELENCKPGLHNLINTYTDQRKVRDGYYKCVERVNHLIIKLDYKITQDENKDQFFTYPHKILPLNEIKTTFFTGSDLHFIK